MPILFFDTETTGKVDRRKEPQDPAQPDLVQLAAILTDDDLNEVASLNCIIFPTRWEIPVEAANVHGISQEKAKKYGIALPTALTGFLDLAGLADRFVAHNIEFDQIIMRRAPARIRETATGDRLVKLLGLGDDPFDGKECRCTMKAAKPILKLPNRNPGINDAYKFPKLEECIRHFFNEGIENAHDALADVRATIRLYRALCDHYGMAP